MNQVLQGIVHKGIIKTKGMFEENEKVLIIRVSKSKISKVDKIAGNLKEFQDHSFVEEIIEATKHGEGID
ncbi:MAG: hypothetical protein Q7J35_14605 [Candidatus Methanoperedens sp.]|nr:hypothetical protein [Candidatus Methanoperedens sp.]